MEQTYEEYKDWVNGDCDTDVQKQYKKALAKLKECQSYEEQLVSLVDFSVLESSIIQWSNLSNSR